MKQTTHALVLAVLQSLLTWNIIRFTLLPGLSFGTYALVEVILVLFGRLYNLALQKLLPEDPGAD